MELILAFLVGFGFFVDEQGLMVKKPQVSYELYFFYDIWLEFLPYVEQLLMTWILDTAQK